MNDHRRLRPEQNPAYRIAPQFSWFAALFCLVAMVKIPRTEVHMSIEFAGAAKARELRKYFSRHGRIYIVVNTTVDDVLVPEHLRGDPALRLVLNVRMPQHIHIGDEALESDFSFSGSVFHCVIPMHAIWAAYIPEQQLENGILWENDVPETIRAVVRAVRSIGEEDGNAAPLSAVQQNHAIPGEVRSDGESNTGRRGHLRVVK
jgi:stringent starvation protein B